jgi:hypothetical protein
MHARTFCRSRYIPPSLSIELPKGNSWMWLWGSLMMSLSEISIFKLLLTDASAITMYAFGGARGGRERRLEAAPAFGLKPEIDRIQGLPVPQTKTPTCDGWRCVNYVFGSPGRTGTNDTRIFNPRFVLRKMECTTRALGARRR